MSNKDALMVKTVFALGQGGGGTEISEKAAAWFHGRYYEWIDKPKKSGKSPQDVWDTHGKEFLDHFRQIGKLAADASSNGAIEPDTLEQHALDYEKSLDCPWCPDRE